jgi:hypothetical protein
MKSLPVFLLFILISYTGNAQPVMKNPGLPARESFAIHELVDPSLGYATTHVNVSLLGQGQEKYYAIQVREGNYFQNDIRVRYDDLTTLSETRTDLRTNKIIQSYKRTGNRIRFVDNTKQVDKIYNTDETNIYSPLAYFFSFRGYPFKTGGSVSFKTYMYEYDGVLTMNLELSGRRTVTVKAGTYDCYILELSVGGWQSLFASDTYYLYFTVANPHIFVKYEEKIDDKWCADELVQYEK